MSRELDAEVARVVFGWTWEAGLLSYTNAPVFAPPNRSDRVVYAGWGDGRYYSVDLPYYSTDIAAAWEVEGKIAQQGEAVWFRYVMALSVILEYRSNAVDGTAGMLRMFMRATPEQRCRAALAACAAPSAGEERDGHV